MPYESAPPLAIIVGAITAMGGIQALGNWMIYGKPKPIGHDNFDRRLLKRDALLQAEAEAKK